MPESLPGGFLAPPVYPRRDRGGSPTLIAPGNSTAPTKAMAGEGRITEATIIMTKPMTQKVIPGDFMIPCTGRNVISAKPVSYNILAMAAIKEMMTTTLKSSLKATVTALKMA